MTTENSCDHDCDPHAPGVRSLGASHYLDCPVWIYLGVVSSPGRPAGGDAV